MSVVRVVKTRGYTVMSNFHLRDGRLSLKAKGLMSVMLSLPEGWDYTLKGLASIGLDGIDAVRSGMVELEKAGYVTRERSRDEKGRLAGCDYTVYERPPEPRENPTTENPALDYPTQGIPVQGNPTQSIKEGANKEGLITKGTTTEEGARAPEAPNKPPREPRHRHGEFGHVFLSDSDFERLKQKFPADWAEKIRELDEYIETSGKHYRNHLLVIERWDKRGKQEAAASGGKACRYQHDEGDVL